MTEQDIDRIIEMAWEDRTPFEAIRAQFGLPEAEVIALMRRHMKASSLPSPCHVLLQKNTARHTGVTFMSAALVFFPSAYPVRTGKPKANLRLIGKYFPKKHY